MEARMDNRYKTTEGVAQQGSLKQDDIRTSSSSNPKKHEHDNPRLVRRVGTHKLITCVGVYFSLGPNRCFFAHINALVMRQHNWRLWRDEYQRDVKDEGEAEYYRRRVNFQLEQHAKWNAWDPAEHRSDIARSLIIACPVMEGRTVLLGVESEKEVEGHKKSGFVVEHPGGKPVMLSYDATEGLPPPELEQYAPLDETNVEQFEITLDLNPGSNSWSPLM
ncbi:hypothetical protein LTR78_008835 [Recurvomyces mirabilis]|uniref:Uncharacterized protein n=1 Tax=Recurvomyces mirabilis TaxID=574656 RepID=A0AAE0WGR8_9PEZI|nr:hypothetical protein LTR78_008835 [Recurvomyces mirabilis]KAK5155750.1 hypothetical protein LTS14_005316 [Recurvomyces mirabilis]